MKLRSASTVKLYTTFHLNLAYSSIEEEQRAEVVRRCYWPLLRLARQQGLPFGIEAPAYTLEAAAEADPSWLDELRYLTSSGLCEFIGAGYAQVIAPLVPAEVNAANLRIGQERYEQLLGFRPTVGLINEQAYSAGLLSLYRDAGFEAIVMEWDNPAMTHFEWNPEWRYLPQIALGQHGEEMPLLWNKSLAFQKVQRYAHGEIELNEYLEYLGGHVVDDKVRAFNLYGNDIEVFDFRPGRFHTEAVLQEGVEWERIGAMFEALQSDNRFEFVRPSQVLDLMDLPGAGNRLRLESAEQPVPVKKQGKYNLTRWAVTPRDDLNINTTCWRTYERLRDDPAASSAAWKELCYLWGSDFRTHITAKRWAAYRERLESFASQLGVASTSAHRWSPVAIATSAAVDDWNVERSGRFLLVENEHVRLRLNTRRGLAIDALAFHGVSEDPLVGTLDHGYYDDISLGADYYTGHFVLEPPNAHKITDLEKVSPEIVASGDELHISATVDTAAGPFRKSIVVSGSHPQIEIVYEFDWAELALGSFRLGHVTLMPTAFDRATLRYATHNGGADMDSFDLAGSAIDLGRPVSSLVSASGGLGVTGGVIEIGDQLRGLRVSVDKTAAAVIGLVEYREIGDTYFCRLCFSALEMDETTRLVQHVEAPQVVRVALQPRTAGGR